MAPRNHNGYDVYLIVEGQPFPICYPPYHNNKDHDWGMTDYPEFDYNAKTILYPYLEGGVKYDGCKYYSVNKTQKDTIVVNGHIHFFNIEKMKDVKC